MTEHPLDPQRAYEALAEALRIFHEPHDQPLEQSSLALQEAVARATDAWQRCEPLRATREKEFRYHVVKLKLLLAGAYQMLDALPGVHLLEAA